jgi:predicted hydrocarbon binding protein
MGTQRDIRIPADSIHALRRSLSTTLGAGAANRTLQEAGFAAGDALYERITREVAEDAGATPATSFWDRLASILRELGWGAMRHEEVHGGVGALVVTDWFEVDPGARRAACPFTTGVLANLLGRLAGEDVAVLQTDCADGQPGCARFLFGSAGVLDGVYAGLREGRDLDAALSMLD